MVVTNSFQRQDWYSPKGLQREGTKCATRSVFLAYYLTHTHTIHMRGRMGSFIWITVLQVGKRLYLNPRSCLSSIWLPYFWAGARIVCKGERRGKREALKMIEFTSDSELASCISSWGKKFRTSDKKLLAFWTPLGGRFPTFQKVF